MGSILFNCALNSNNQFMKMIFRKQPASRLLSALPLPRPAIRPTTGGASTRVCRRFLPGLLCLFLAFMAQAAPGDLDTSFAGTGRTNVGFGFGQDYGRVVVVQPDGKVVVAGTAGLLLPNGNNLAVVRYDTNNVLDPSFANGGKLVAAISSSTNVSLQLHISAIQIQPDGRLVAAGDVYDNGLSYMLLVRLNPDGSFDNSFGVNGIAANFAGSTPQLNAMVIQSDGKFVVAGLANSEFAVARFLTNGLPDPSFGGSGIVLDTANGDSGAYGVTLQPDGKIVAVGTGGFDLAVLRYTTGGALDGTFGPAHNGKVFTHFGGSGDLSFASAVAIELSSDFFTPNRIAVVGYGELNSVYTSIEVACYKFDGSLDSTFGGSGVVTKLVGPKSTFPNSLLIQGSGFEEHKIIVTGFSDTSADFGETFCVVRYNNNGTLDSTFNGNGIVTTSFGPGADEAFGSTLIAGGRLLVVGSTVVSSGNTDFALARYNLSDGSPDTTFNGGGKMTQDIFDRTALVKGLAVQADGKIVAAGSADDGSNDRFVMARFNLDGTLDRSFGFFGKVISPLGTNYSSANAVVIQPDGKIVAAGNSGSDFAVARFTTNGVLDPSFNGSGFVTTTMAQSGNTANAIALQSDGKIVVAGLGFNGANDDFAIARYNTNGTLDTSFDGDGKVITAIDTGEDVATGVKIQADGKIVAAGYAIVGGAVDFAATRYATNGALDTSFGSFGRVATVLGSGGAIGTAMDIQPDEKILVAGYTSTGSDLNLGLARYATNGLLDPSFNGTGKVITAIGLGTDFGMALALQTDGKIIVAGGGTIGAHQEFAAVRYRSTGDLDDSYGLGGKAIVAFNNGFDNSASAIAVDSLGRTVIAGQAGGLFTVARLQGDPVLKILSLTRLPNHHALLTGLGVPNTGHTLQGSTNMVPANFAPVGQVTADAFGHWQYDDSTAVPLPRRFYRLALP
jgi:uncharacterized delta-60 repeat protein